MPRSRSRHKQQQGRRNRRLIVPDSSVLIDLLQALGPDPEADPLLFDTFDRAAWSFHAGPFPWYTEPGSISRHLARLRAREWFLLDFELPSGMTFAEEWADETEGQPGSAGRRRAVDRFLDSECGVFDVEDVRPDGWLRLVSAVGGEVVVARPIDQPDRMLPGLHAELPQFVKGDTIVGRLYWLDEERAELSAGSERITPEARRDLLADPPGREALRSALVVESLFGADAGRVLSMAGDVRFPRVVEDLLVALSDGTFGYRQLWRELEGEADPVAVSRQLLAELDAWSGVEQELLACAVVGTWLRRTEAAAGRETTPATFERERRVIEEHLRTILDVPGEPGLSLPPGVARLAMSPEDAADIAALETEPVEWVVDVRRDDWTTGHGIRPVPSPYPLSCAIVEQAISAFDDLVPDGNDVEDSDWSAGNDGAEEGAEAEDVVPGRDLRGSDPGERDLLDEDDLEDEGLDEDGLNETDDGEPQLIRAVTLAEGEDEALVVLETLVDEALSGEEPLPRPERIVFRQRRLAACLEETLRDAGFQVALRYFTEVVDEATLHGEDHDGAPETQQGHGGHEGRQADAQRGERAAGRDGRAAPRLSIDELRLHERLLAAASRSHHALEDLASLVGEPGSAPIAVTPATPLAFPFATLEGEQDHVGAFAVVPLAGIDGVSIDLLFVPPAALALDLHGREGELLLDGGDRITIEMGQAEEVGEDYARAARAAGWPCGDAGFGLIAFRARPDGPPAFLRGRELEVAAAVMEAVAVLADAAEKGPGWQDSLAVALRVEPLGDVKVAWRAER